MKKRESLFKEQVIKELRIIPACWFFKTNELSLLGIPDIIGCLRGKFFALELKKDITSKPTKLQLYVLSKITQASGYAVVAYPENWEEVKKGLISL